MEYYKIVSAEIRHENELINHRLTWLIYLQTILFAAFFLVASYDHPAIYWDRFRFFIYSVAFLSCAHSLLGIIIAARAARRLRKRFWEQVSAHGEDPDNYPDPVARNRGNIVGLWLAKAVPVLICFAWIYVSMFLPSPH